MEFVSVYIKSLYIILKQEVTDFAYFMNSLEQKFCRTLSEQASLAYQVFTRKLSYTSFWLAGKALLLLKLPLAVLWHVPLSGQMPHEVWEAARPAVCACHSGCRWPQALGPRGPSQFSFRKLREDSTAIVKKGTDVICCLYTVSYIICIFHSCAF